MHYIYIYMVKHFRIQTQIFIFYKMLVTCFVTDICSKLTSTSSQDISKYIIVCFEMIRTVMSLANITTQRWWNKTERKFNGFLTNFRYAIIPHDLRASTVLTELNLVNFIDLLPFNSITGERWHDYLVIVNSNLLVPRESPADWSKTESYSLLT